MGSSFGETRNSGRPHHNHCLSSSNNHSSSASVTILSVPSTSSWATEEIEVGYNSPSQTPEPVEANCDEALKDTVIPAPVSSNHSPVKVKKNKSGKLGLFARTLSAASDRTSNSFNSIKSSSKRPGGGIRIGKTLAGFRKSKKNANTHTNNFSSNNNNTNYSDSAKSTLREDETNTTATTTTTNTTSYSTNSNFDNMKSFDVDIGKTSEMDSYPSNHHNSRPRPRVLEHSLNGNNGNNTSTTRRSSKNSSSKKDGLEGIPESNSVHQGRNCNNNNTNSNNRAFHSSSQSNPQTPNQFPMEWPKRQYSQQMQELHDRELQNLEVEQAGRRRVKERDGFCRRVDSYDGQTIAVDGKNAYELGSYLGDGVAGVVYEATRLLPAGEYPIRTGPIHPLSVPPFGNQNGDAGKLNGHARQNSLLSNESDTQKELQQPSTPTTPRLEYEWDPQTPPQRKQNSSQNPLLDLQIPLAHSIDMEETVAVKILNPVGFRIFSPAEVNTFVVVQEGEPLTEDIKLGLRPMAEQHVWWLVSPKTKNLKNLLKKPSQQHPLASAKAYLDNKDVTVLGTHSSNDSYSASNSGNRYSHYRSEYIDRGSANRGLKLTLIAAFKDPKTGSLRELPLTKCIEIWGHAPFGATEEEFEEMMDAIERVNEGRAPAVPSSYSAATGTPSKLPVRGSFYSSSASTAPTRVMTADSSAWSEDLSSWSPHPNNGNKQSSHTERSTSGLFRAAASQRTVVFCKPLTAHVGVPAVPAKYLKWLRQRRAATREIRNMMRIGRHKNVVHLHEVLEHIQESKSTMFLILELVRGGELFDLISSNTSSPSNSQILKKLGTHWEGAEMLMLKFFKELVSGIAYCHANGIAHRDLKPENLLVHNGLDGEECTLKIADFGLSAAFALSSRNANSIIDKRKNQDGFLSYPGNNGNNMSQTQSPKTPTPASPEPVTGLSPLFHGIPTLTDLSSQALSLFTCGQKNFEELCSSNDTVEDLPSEPIRRMTSVVGSPHYVAPEIISQPIKEDVIDKSRVGYDGTKADVWSSGVILYAMLFRSLPFGEDLLRCPRYQSFYKWYKFARKQPGSRRASAEASLVDDYSQDDVEEMLGPHWFFPSKTSVESRDMIMAMLNPNPEHRISIQQVSQHPWLKREVR